MQNEMTDTICRLRQCESRVPRCRQEVVLVIKEDIDTKDATAKLFAIKEDYAMFS